MGLSRRQLFVVAAAGALAGPASAAIPDGDLAYARLLIGTELLAADFYTRAIAAKRLTGARLAYLKRALFNEGEHLTALSGVLSGAGQTPAGPDDFDFTYPKGSFDSPLAIAKLGVTLETTSLGAYLGAVGSLQTDALRQAAARIAASEAQHLGLLTRMSGGDPIGISFPSALTIEQASDALDSFTS
jgi:hypothetical protein